MPIHHQYLVETDSITAVLGPEPCVLVRIQGSLNEQMVARKNGQIDISGDILNSTLP